MTYTLPQIADPDNDAFKLIILLQETIAFTKITNNSITFSPKDKDAKIAPYLIKIVLTD